MKVISLLALYCFVCLTACAGLHLELHNSSVQKPSNVALYFSVETRDGLPVPGLTAESFRIYEDDRLISPFESKQTILNPEVAVISYIVLLLDMSGSITESGSLPTLIEAAGSFSEQITRKHHVAVYGFDGGAKLIPVVDFSTSHAAVQRGLKHLSHKRVKDPSTNLNGAVVESVKVLEGQMSRSRQPLRFGTLVIFTDGTDRAHRVTEDAMFEVLDEAGVNVFVIGVGGEISVDQLAKLGRTGFVQAAEMTAISAAFEDVAALIEAAGKKFYLLSYCSPARAGIHTLSVVAETAGLSGSLETPFDASGFGPRCNPNKQPVFSVGRIRIR